jgi:hypothetical protein
MTSSQGTWHYHVNAHIHMEETYDKSPGTPGIQNLNRDNTIEKNV